MSKRNSQQAKRAARERLQAEREKQAKREKVRRQVTVGVSLVAVLAVAGGIAFAVSKMGGNGGEGDNSDWSVAQKVADKSADGTVKIDGQSYTYAKPKNASGKDGTDIVVGEKSAKHTLDVYEDMRCPICSQFEQLAGETITKDVESGKYKASFNFGAFIDKNPAAKGTGSRNALSALGASLDVSPEAFLQYKKALFSKKNHPEEQDDGFASDDRLLEIADQVKELKGNKTFKKAVEESRYDAWALKVAKKFDKSKVQGTPTLKLDGVHLKADSQGSPPMSPAQLNKLVDQQIKKGGKEKDSKE
ncbi:thioredoxin domain-containing protein [Streptomyces sp. NPDC005438]|uniref:thioredoxin domain-containing protein n=1 Tax=Streptomyces sp. NPDC005438 TaxID=3156880 RepID=UPI0033B8CA22